MNRIVSDKANYDAAYRGHSWSLPAQLNMGAQIADEPVDRSYDAPAIIDGSSGEVLTFGQLSAMAARLTGALMREGAKRGDRVAVIAPQGFSTAIVHAAILRAGLVGVPLSERYGRDALEHRLNDSGASFAFVSPSGRDKLNSIAGGLTSLKTVIDVDSEPASTTSLETFIGDTASAAAVATTPDDPALMIYTSGTTGPAKGALHGHRVLAGHMPGFSFAHGDRIAPDAVFYTPADWAWAGGLLNLLFPALSLGFPVVAYADPDGFDATQTLETMRLRGVTHAFLPPTALKLMRAHAPAEALGESGLQSVMSAGEALGRETFHWAREAFGFAIAEAYGQTEANLVIGSSVAHGAMREGATGRPVPGHRVYVVREDGTETEPGEVGEIAVGLPDPVAFLGYWQVEDATRRKKRQSETLGALLMTGDMAMRDMDGFIWFVGRDDDVITSSGHRIGPGEIEDCLTSHPAVSMAAVIGVPDPVRTQIVRAFVVLRNGHRDDDAMARDLRAHVRANLAAHEYPREIRFVDRLPMTTTGKIIRRMLKGMD
ncbi:MAG: AMP-binding protein [Pseudomonadota bacterium]